MTTFVTRTERKDTLTIDGYTTAKSVLGIIKDIGRELKDIMPDESFIFLNCKDNNSAKEFLLSSSESYGGYYLEIENVGCACIYDQKEDRMIYKYGYTNYFCIRLVK